MTWQGALITHAVKCVSDMIGLIETGHILDLRAVRLARQELEELEPELELKES